MGAQSRPRCAVVVLGDFGRSPRMQYHTESLVTNGYDVDVVGYKGSNPIESLIDNPSVNLCLIRPSLKRPKSKMLFPIYAALRLSLDILRLFFVLMLSIPKPQFILVQNPPSMPTLMVALAVCHLRRSKLVIDWHNFGYTILALTVGERSIFVKWARLFERYFGRKGHYHFCVSNKMKDFLREEFKIDATVLYDRPPAHFGPRPLVMQHEFFMRFSEEFGLPHSRSLPVEESPFTCRDMERDELWRRADRPALLISSTSWTPDEDIWILLSALAKLDEQWVAEAQEKQQDAERIRVILAVTGKGPLKEAYLERLRRLDLKHVRVITPWLDLEDYFTIMAASDLGICLHKSSSGFDLPMKVYDMFGSELPVCAVEYKTIHELVFHNVNGLVFEDEAELGEQLKMLLEGFPSASRELDRLRAAVALEYGRETANRWSTNWKEVALPVLKHAAPDTKK